MKTKVLYRLEAIFDDASEVKAVMDLLYGLPGATDVHYTKIEGVPSVKASGEPAKSPRRHHRPRVSTERQKQLMFEYFEKHKNKWFTALDLCKFSPELRETTIYQIMRDMTTAGTCDTEYRNRVRYWRLRGDPGMLVWSEPIVRGELRGEAQ